MIRIQNEYGMANRDENTFPAKLAIKQLQGLLKG